MANTKKKTLRALIPWVISIAILGYLALTTDLVRFFEILRSIDPLSFLAVTVVGVLCTYFSDSFCLMVLFRRFFGHVEYREILAVKGTSYFLNIVNYNAGAGAVAVFASKKKNFGLVESIGTMLFLNAMDIFALTLLITVGLFLGPDVISPDQRTAILWSCAALGAVLFGTILFWVFKVPFLPKKVREYRIFHPFRAGRLADYPLFILLRALFVTQYVLIHWAYLRVFGIHVPFSHLLIYVPVLTIIGVLPITIAGQGTTQIALRHYIAPYPALAVGAPLMGAIAWVGAGAGGTEISSLWNQVQAVISEYSADVTAHIDAYSTACIVGMLIARVSIGLFTMKNTVQDFTGAKET